MEENTKFLENTYRKGTQLNWSHSDILTWIKMTFAAFLG